MELTELNKIFDVKLGNKFDANKMNFVANGEINFISRDSKNNGCVGTVMKYGETEPFNERVITVSLGGSFLLSSFVQPKKFYTAQNVAVLTPLKEMRLIEKLFYCKCISLNRFKYSAFGREANRTLKILKVPKEIPSWVEELTPNLPYTKVPVCSKNIQLDDRKWRFFVYQDLFDIERGRGARKFDVTDNGTTPFITSTDSNNGLIGRVNKNPCHQGNVITVARNGSIAQTFYQPEAFCSTEDIHVFNPKFSLNPYIAMFLIPVIKKEGYKYSYARKWGLERMRISKMQLPVDEDEEPDWHFMEDYIKSLPYSTYIA
jgi:hypothetical protein